MARGAVCFDARRSGNHARVQQDDRSPVSLGVAARAIGLARIGWAAGAIALGLAGVAAVLSVTRHEQLDEPHLRVAGAALAGLFCGGAALSALRLLETRRRELVAAGAALAAVAVVTFVLVVIALWHEDLYDGEPWNFWRALVTGLALTLTGLVVAPLWLLVDIRPLVVRVPFLATCLAAGAAVVVGLVALWRWDPDGETGSETRDLVLRTVIALFALAVAGVLATVAADRAQRARPRPAEPRPGADFEL